MNRGQWTAEQKPSALSKMSKLLLNMHVRPLFNKDLSHRAMQHPSRPKTCHNRVASISMKASESQSFIKACLLHLQVELPWCQPASLNLVYCACWLSLFAAEAYSSNCHTRFMRKLVGKRRFLKLQSMKFGGSLARNARFGAPTCLFSRLWCSFAVAVSMGEAAKPILF